MAEYNAEGRPIWKPMHIQPIYRMNSFETREGDGRAKTNAYIARVATGKGGKLLDVGMDIFYRGLSLPSDNKMIVEEQEIIIEIIKGCFKNEQRLTIYGKFLRSSSIDELPELINILKGDSGIIGTTKKNLDFTRVSLA